jgi:hypothetical protein
VSTSPQDGLRCRYRRCAIAGAFNRSEVWRWKTLLDMSSDGFCNVEVFNPLKYHHPDPRYVPVINVAELR